MPFALVFVGLILVISGSKNTYRQLGNELITEFTGPKNFLYWLMALGAIGAVGYVDQFKTFSRVFMSLVLVSMILANGGFFAKLQQAIASGPVTPTPSPTPSGDSGSSGGSLTGNETADKALQIGKMFLF